MKNTRIQSSAAADVAMTSDIDSLARRFGQMSGMMEHIVPYNGDLPQFRAVTHESMHEIMPYLKMASGRTTDFSYGGLLMWVEYFKYEYAIVDETLFIKGVVENDLSRTAFALPAGKMPIAKSLGILKAWCDAHDMPLVLSAVPEEALDELRVFLPKSVELLEDWGDYLYDASDLATLKGKRYSRKRNHVNQFLNAYPDYSLVPIGKDNYMKAYDFMDVFDLEGDSTPMAIEERQLTRRMVEYFKTGDSEMAGALLMAGDKVGAFTIGDIKGDTLYIHIEKATRHVIGSYEAINNLFAARMLEEHPEIKYINREDDSGDEGLRFAKESYHPISILKKYNVIF